jgi:hypothetical protein
MSLTRADRAHPNSWKLLRTFPGDSFARNLHHSHCFHEGKPHATRKEVQCAESDSCAAHKRMKVVLPLCRRAHRSSANNRSDGSCNNPQCAAYGEGATMGMTIWPTAVAHSVLPLRPTRKAQLSHNVKDHAPAFNESQTNLQHCLRTLTARWCSLQVRTRTSKETARVRSARTKVEGVSTGAHQNFIDKHNSY